MSKFKKLVMIAAVLVGLSSVFVACSDDDPTKMGPVPVNSVRVTSTSVTVIWSIVPNDKCDGYVVSILKGSAEGEEVARQEFDNRTCTATFNGLIAGTKYVVKTQCKPGKGFNDADVFYREFTTSPIVNAQVADLEAYETDGYDDNGAPIVKTYYKATVTWPAIPNTNCGGYSITLYNAPKVDINKDNIIEATQISSSQTTSFTFSKLLPETTYTIVMFTLPNAMCDYANGDPSYFEFTTPAAPAVNN